jgi:sec-independent protein translocase protein TatB
MFLDIGWPEMAVILLVALIVIGPKDLPKVARQVGKWAGKARAMAREFQRSIDDMAREAELDEIKKELQKVQHGSIGQTIRDAVDPEGDLERALDIEDRSSQTKGVAKPAAANGALPEPAPQAAAIGAAEPQSPDPAATKPAAVKPAAKPRPSARATASARRAARSASPTVDPPERP